MNEVDACDGCPAEDPPEFEADGDGCIDGNSTFAEPVHSLRLPPDTAQAIPENQTDTMTNFTMNIIESIS